MPERTAKIEILEMTVETLTKSVKTLTDDLAG